MKRGRKHNAVEVATVAGKMLQARETGMLITDIASQFNYTEQGVRYLLAKYGNGVSKAKVFAKAQRAQQRRTHKHRTHIARNAAYVELLAHQESRRDEIRTKYATGKTLAELASEYGVTRQRIQQIVGTSRRPRHRVKAGQTFGQLTVLYPAGRIGKTLRWYVLCKCGNIIKKSVQELVHGSQRCRKCMYANRPPCRPRVDLTGRQFGHWTVLEYAGHGDYFCCCDCGTLKKVRSQNLTSGKTKSCGCHRGDWRQGQQDTHDVTAPLTY